MFKLIDSEKVLSLLDEENDAPIIEAHQTQIRLAFNCGCIITQDRSGEHIIQCSKHNYIINEICKGL